MALIYLGSVEAASDATMATVTNTVGSQFRAALTGLITSVISQNPAVIAAAEAAVASALTAAIPAAVDAGIARADVLRGPEHRSPRQGDISRFRARDTRGLVGAEVRPDGTFWAARIESPMIVSPSIGGGGVPVKRVNLIAVLGQSNPVGKGVPVIPLLDGESSRIWQLPAGGSTLEPATVPLAFPGGTATGLAPAHAMARKMVQNDPECVVVLIPMAKGGSGLVTDPALGYGKWEVSYNGPNPRLYADAVAAMAVALPLIAAQWGITPSVTTHWGQGEADGADAVTRAAYTAALDTLITDWLGRFGGTFIITGMVPQALGTGTRAQIELALQDTPRRLEKVAYVAGLDNGGGPGGPSDVIHFAREAIEQLGQRMFGAIPRAFNNTASSHTYPPLIIGASKWGNEVDVSWTPPYSRVTSYEVQSSTDGTTWGPVAMPEPVATRVKFTSAAPVRVRVRSIGTETSNWTASVPAIGG